jgi:hypothetical protein
MMTDVKMVYGDFTYDSALDEDDDVRKYMHYVYYKGEFAGMMPHSSYSIPSKDEFMEWCYDWKRKRETERW